MHSIDKSVEQVGDVLRLGFGLSFQQEIKAVGLAMKFFVLCVPENILVAMS